MKQAFLGDYAKSRRLGINVATHNFGNTVISRTWLVIVSEGHKQAYKMFLT